jgi:hypothetical protein
MRPWRQPVPSVRVNTDEDRLEEEGEPLQREPEPEHVPEVSHPLRPQQPQLERQDRPGHDTDREQREHDPGPAPRERPVQGIAGSQVAVFGEQDEHGERDPEAHQRDVHGQRQRLHLPRLVEVMLVDAHEDQGTPHYYNL